MLNSNWSSRKPKCSLPTVLSIVTGILFSLVQYSNAQVSGYGTINGTITDSSGALIAGANITVANIDTGAKRETTTSSSGDYAATDLPVGHYSVTVSHAGFKTTAQSDIILTASQVAAVNITLTVGQTQETVEVSAGQQMLETTSTSLNETINSTTVEELPLGTRNPGFLTFLLPGAVNGSIARQDNVLGGAGSGVLGEVAANVDGSRMGGVYYEVDGIPNNDTYLGEGNVFPDPDATQEFRSLTGNYSAAYGGGGTAIVNVATRSGSNSWHGTAYEFDRNQFFNAPEWFSKLKDTYTQNIYGLSVGGPIQKGKHFIFGNIEQFKANLGGTGATTSVPTPAMVNNGDFSGAYPCTGTGYGDCPTQLYYPSFWAGYNPMTGVGYGPGSPSANPFLASLGCSASNPNTAGATGTPGPCGSNGWGKPIPGNNVQNTPGMTPAIWSSLVSPVSLNILNVADSNYATNTNTAGLVNIVGIPTNTKLTQFDIKYDYYPNSKNHIMGRYWRYNQNQPAAYTSTNAIGLNGATAWLGHTYNVAANWTYTPSATLVNSAYFGYDYATSEQAPGVTASWKDVGANIPMPVSAIEVFFASFNIVGQNVPIFKHDYKFGDSVSLTRGKNLIVAGVDILQQYDLQQASWGADAPTWMQGTNTNSAFSDFLLGYDSQFFQSGGQFQENQGPQFDAYVQDDYKLRPNLTLDLGVRWEPNRPLNQVPSNRGSYFVPGACSGNPPVCTESAQSSVYTMAPPGLLYIGDKGVPSGLYDAEWHRFFPRVGIAWQPTFLPNTSIRAGGGEFSLPIYTDYYGSANPPFEPGFTLTPNNGDVGYGGAGQPLVGIPVANPWSAFTPTNGVDPFVSAGFAFGQGGKWNENPNQPFVTPTSISNLFPPGFKLATIYNWNLSVQHEFGRNLMLEVAYVGQEGSHIAAVGDWNPGVYATGGLRTRYAWDINGSPNCASTSNGGCFGSVDEYIFGGTTSYEGVHFIAEKRFSHGLQFNSNFAYSRTMDDSSRSEGGSGGHGGGNVRNAYNIGMDHGISALNVPYVWNNFGTWRLPAFRNHGPLAEGALGNWEVSGVYTLAQGEPFGINSNTQNSLDQQGNDWADVVPGVPFQIHHGSKFSGGPANCPAAATNSYGNGWLNCYFNPNAFVNNALGTYGDSPRQVGYAPREDNVDMTFAKNFPFYHEQYRFQFRWEIYNILNHPWFNWPNNQNSQSGSTEGQITSVTGQVGGGGLGNNTTGLPRIMQFAVKFYW